MVPTQTLSLVNPKYFSWLYRAFSLAVGLLAFPLCASAVDEQTFASPQDAVNALTAAAQNDDTNALHAIFGPMGQELVSPDVVQATTGFKHFVQYLTKKTQLVTNSDTNFTLEIGVEGWPFPIPLVRQDGQWFFDTEAGKQEIFDRRIGRDELGAIAVCRAYVNAQREYASEDRGSGILEYAQHLRSTPGTHDGLFWPAKDGEELSPLGPLVAQARGEGYHHSAKMMNEQAAPYHGYYFKILTRQGRHAPIGKYNYIINGHMIAGFALVAWPAEWSNTGVMTFIVNQQGKVYQKNLGPETVKIASAMAIYDPDKTWTLVQ